MSIRFQISSLWIVIWATACGTAAPQRPLYKSETSTARSSGTELDSDASGSDDATLNDSSNDTPVDENLDADQGEVVEEPEEPAVDPAEEAAAQLRATGKQAYETECMSCHGEPAATTLNSRDAMEIAGQSGLIFHGGVANYPNQQIAEGIVAFLTDPNQP
ncbi:hypothetical protein [Pseudobacteriovorax antillogorgiicola]|uniref:Cytochrome c domain-containing protein n=1 Tax=Pseudobacteriovorax antillogorgiicola TaxID=1513793 RepID=A0A1Y6BTF5_9BACT|nr:hypothetical protein [Pseudobacteriovorax antillogorgiicola]TCS52968.1 hypothetical protein EDD56_10819 [Pseudobacteriovorax antillogorgiicola]SMF27466.1 hypothetical protein SAMN06296036_108228 [Pseudobacteriovorax antillogorgiicola]